MEKELNYLRSEIAKIRMEKEKAQFSNTGWLEYSKHNKTDMAYIYDTFYSFIIRLVRICFDIHFYLLRLIKNNYS